MERKEVNSENTNNGVDREDETRALQGNSQEESPPEHQFSQGQVDSENDFCSCARAKVAVSDGDEQEFRCPLCGKVISLGQRSATRGGQQITDSGPPHSAGGTAEPVNLLLGEAFTNRLNFLPNNADEISSSQNSSDSSMRQSVDSTVLEQGKIPTEGVFD